MGTGILFGLPCALLVLWTDRTRSRCQINTCQQTDKGRHSDSRFGSAGKTALVPGQAVRIPYHYLQPTAGFSMCLLRASPAASLKGCLRSGTVPLLQTRSKTQTQRSKGDQLLFQTLLPKLFPFPPPPHTKLITSQFEIVLLSSVSICPF